MNGEVSETNATVSRSKHELSAIIPQFTSETFSVDNFVKTNRNKVSLELLKEELSSYLRTLNVSMIELINEDYTDFVNLSTNLMGLDKCIANLSIPLKTLRTDAIRTEQQFNTIIKKLELKMDKRNIISYNKKELRKLITIINSIDTADKWFNRFEYSVANDVSHSSHSFCDIEKIVLIVTKIENEFKSLRINIPLVSQQIKPRLELISNALFRHLESGYFSAITNNDLIQFQCILRIYSLNGKHSQLENLFQQNIVKPYMDEVICETVLGKNGVNFLFDKVLDFIDLKCQLIINCQNDIFSFMINSVWNEIANCLIVRTPSLFNAGNPDQFHSQYMSTRAFIDSFIINGQISRSQLFSEPLYIELMKKFNLEVYFHIRYGEIASKFELSLEERTFDTCRQENDLNSNNFNLIVTHTLYECLTMCWSTQTIFITNLFASFWKLTLQLFSRYSQWLQNINDFEAKLNLNNFSSDNSLNKYSNQSIILCLLVNDCERLFSKANSFFVTNILALKPDVISDKELREHFSDSLKSVEINGLSNIITQIKLCLISQCDVILKQVNDVPRLYRKTNKDIPTKASNYITNCVDAIKTFTSTGETQIWKKEWTEHILAEVTLHFKIFTSEVLTSVQKIENSLKRLKKAKAGNHNNQLKKNMTMTDDDKIRLQICYDIEEYGKQCEERLFVKKESIKHFTELYEMANTSKNFIN